MSSNYIDYRRLSYLGDKVRDKIATKQEKDEFMLMLRENGNITRKQYDDYLANQNTDEIVKAALSVGAIILIGYLLKEMFSKK